MLRFLIVAAATVAMAAASTQHRHPNSNHRQFQERQGFGVQGGFGAGDAFNVNGGVQLGNPLAGNNLIMPIVIGLGVLTFINLIADVFSWFSINEPKTPKDDNTTEKPDDSRSGRELTDMAFSVLDAIQNLQDQYATPQE